MVFKVLVQRFITNQQAWKRKYIHQPATKASTMSSSRMFLASFHFKGIERNDSGSSTSLTNSRVQWLRRDESRSSRGGRRYKAWQSRRVRQSLVCILGLMNLLSSWHQNQGKGKPFIRWSIERNPQYRFATFPHLPTRHFSTFTDSPRFPHFRLITFPHLPIRHFFHFSPTHHFTDPHFTDSPL